MQVVTAAGGGVRKYSVAVFLIKQID